MAFTDSNTASCTIAAYRAWANGFWPSVTAVFTAITFQSNTTSAFATADPNRVAINMHRPRTRFFVSYIFFIVLPPDSSLAFGSGDRHIRGKRRLLSISESVSRRYALCRSKAKRGLYLGQPLPMWCRIAQLPWGVPWLPSQLEWSNRSGLAGATRLICVLGGSAVAVTC